MSKNDNTVTVLHAIEDACAKQTYGSAGVIVQDVMNATGLNETAVRKAVKELQSGGFVDVNGADGRAKRFRAVRKQEQPDPPKAKGKTKADTKEEQRGRPRDPEAQARDDRALELIKSGTGKVADIAIAMDTTRGLAYLSVWRLKKLGLVKKEATGTRAPNYVPA